MQLLTVAQPLGSVAAVAGARPAAARPVAVRVAARSAVRAMATPPKGVTQPPRRPVAPPPLFGFVDTAERINSRAAMIGFIALLLIEGITNKSILQLAGLTVGKGFDGFL